MLLGYLDVMHMSDQIRSDHTADLLHVRCALGIDLWLAWILRG